MNILGISCFYHDSAAALVTDGCLVAAAAEERFTGIKHDAEFPAAAIQYCLEKAGLSIAEIDRIVFYDKPFTKFDRILNSYLRTAPRSYAAFRKAIPVWLRQKLWLPQTIKKELGYDGPVLFIEHHLSHAAGTYFSSPFERAAILTIDGVGEWATGAIGAASGNEIRLDRVMNYPHSVGLLYSAFTYFLGFQVNSAEYKVMGLAPYGTPRYTDLIEKKLVRIFDDGSIHLNMRYFDYHYGLRMTGKRFAKLFGRPRRDPDTPLTETDRDIAASIQQVTEKIVLQMARHTRNSTGENNLCLSGGVALNCAAAGKLLKANLFDKIYIQPAATDSGGAAGAALYIYYALTGDSKRGEQDYLNLGPSYPATELKAFLDKENIPYTPFDRDNLPAYLARTLADQKIVALFRGPMEFGPRALGFRSILADPRRADMKERINRAVKFREPFRPFAPAVTEERAAEYFDCDRPSPYMLFNFSVRESKHEVIPAVTHIDGTARLQTVGRNQNRLLHDILNAFEHETGVAVLLNTSFNLRGHPIVRTPQDAFRTFISSGIDILVLENMVIDKTKLDPARFEAMKISSGTD